ncbi:MAG: DUF2723 domain-containing protein [Saprospiraceae bacterium]|nr:DUF2723 domain-containing protein [Saprospiraceae bacterium]
MKNNYQKLANLGGWLVFLISLLVYYFSAERSGSLWDCGEFILGAYKLQVVHPPGAPLFLLIGRLFAWGGDILSSNPANIAFAVNLLSGMCTAGAAMLVGWTTMILGRLSLVGRDKDVDQTQSLLLVGAGVVAGLATAFSSSVWFSAVEGEVYALSTFFTTLTLWATVKWYSLPDVPDSDRWLIFAFYSAGLSTGVHLLSILTFPALAMLYYFKKNPKPTWTGMVVAFAAGAVLIGVMQALIITGLPNLWASLELMMVNGLGLPFHSGLIPLTLIVGAVIFYAFRYAHRKNNPLLQKIFVAFCLVLVSYSIIGVVMIRASAGPPINMNEPTDAHRLLPYLNREQYGERALIRGPHFDAQPIGTEVSDKYGRVGDRYEKVDYRVKPVYNSSDEMLFPRLGHNDSQRKQLYRLWLNKNTGTPTMADNLSFFFRYQIGWMYWRYFMWNFAGRQNGDQGFFPWDLKRGQWLSGIPFLDSGRLFNQSELPTRMKNDKGRNRYFLLPFILGIIGLIYHFKARRNDAIAMLALFFITGIGIIIYSNQPPNEPRERDYVLVGSICTFCIWIGLSVPALFQFMMRRIRLGSHITAPLALGLVMIAPLLMGFQNFDDHSRRNLSGARDFANNFLESCDPNAIIFTYGDNDTYPLWYAQEVEGIRTDVRVVNLSLIAVDWYINQLRRKINDSPAILLSLEAEDYRGSKRNALYHPPNAKNDPMSLQAGLQFMGEYHPLPASSGREFESYLPSKQYYIDIDKTRAVSSGWVSEADSANIVSRIPVNIADGSLTKDELAVLDLLHSNMYTRPIYFSVTTREGKLMGLNDYMQLEGLGLKFIPIKSPKQSQFGIHGNGRMDVDEAYTRIMDKFKWGGFDKYDLYITSSFMPSFYAHKTLFERTAYELLAKGDNDRAVTLVDKYFEAFPNMNFPYNVQTLNLLRVYERALAYDKLKVHLDILAADTEENLAFYQSLSTEALNAGFAADQRAALQVVGEMKRMATTANDTEFLNELKQRFDVYEVQGVKG